MATAGGASDVSGAGSGWGGGGGGGAFTSPFSFSAASSPSSSAAAAMAPPTLQVVNEGGEMLDRAPWFDSESELGAECYAVVACLGCQGSGKSTLLNRLFGTQFAVAPRGARRLGRATSKGIAVSQAASRQTVLVMDVEGGDARERGAFGGGANAAGRDLQSLAARFAASVADVVILNVWYHDLGRYDAVPMAQLRAVLAECACGEGPLLRTMILVTVRDAEPSEGAAAAATATTKEEEEEQVRETVVQDAEELWSSLPNKSRDAAGAGVTEFFDFRVALLPHIRHDAQGFESAVRALSRDFLHTEELFAPEYSKGLPADGFAAFSKRLWDGIRSTAPPAGAPTAGAGALAVSRDAGADAADASSEELVAAYRCDEVYSALLRSSAEEMAEFAAKIEDGEKISAFGRKADDLVGKYLDSYDSSTATYADTDARDRKRAELESVLDTSLQSLFLKQLQLIRENALQHFKTASSSEEVPGDFAFYTADAMFQREAEDSVRPGSEWSYANERSDLQQTMAEISSRRKQLIHSQIQAAEQQRQAMQYMQLQQAQMQAMQQQQYSGGGALGNWNIGAAYRPPDTNVNLSMLHQQGRTQLQVSMVPDEQAGMLGPNGFTSGVGPGNLGLSFNVNI